MKENEIAQEFNAPKSKSIGFIYFKESIIKFNYKRSLKAKRH